MIRRQQQKGFSIAQLNTNMPIESHLLCFLQEGDALETLLSLLWANVLLSRMLAFKEME